MAQAWILRTINEQWEDICHAIRCQIEDETIRYADEEVELVASLCLLGIESPEPDEAHLYLELWRRLLE